MTERKRGNKLVVMVAAHVESREKVATSIDIVFHFL